MQDRTCAAPQCSRPQHNGMLCASCFGTLHKDLAAVPALLEDLDTTISRQDRVGDSNGKRTEIPLPLRIGPMEAKRDLRDTLWKWARGYANTRKTPLSWATPTAELAEWLLHHLHDISDHPDAGQCADEIGYGVLIGERAVDRRLQAVYAGPCDKCGADLYAKVTARVVACRNEPCDAEYDVPARREWLLDRARDHLLTATEMSRALPGLLEDLLAGRPLTSSMIRNWASRGHLVPHGHSARREPLYRVRDVIEALVRIRPRKSHDVGLSHVQSA